LAKKIIILDVSSPSPQELAIRYIFWIPTPFPVQRPNALSLWNNASTSELDAIRNGNIIEEQFIRNFPSTLGVQAIKDHLTEHYRSRVIYFDSMPRPGQYYGIYFDGTTWSA